jgi:hypothetical protein
MTLVLFFIPSIASAKRNCVRQGSAAFSKEGPHYPIHMVSWADIYRLLVYFRQ